MKRIILGLLFVTLSSSMVFPLPRQQKQNLRKNVLPRRTIAEGAVLAYYVKEFQPQAEVSPEVFAKVQPFLEQFIQDRFESSQRRTRALNQLRQGIQRGAPEDELKKLVRDFDSADAEFQANQEKFLNNVDPLLNTRQQAKLRIFQVLADTYMRQVVNSLQNANPNRGAATQP